MIAAPVAGLVAATEAWLRSLGDGRVADFLRAWPESAIPTRATEAHALPVLRWLEEACAADHDVTRRLLALAPVLSWRQTYAEADFGPEFLQRYGWTELIGQRGPVPSAVLAAGFLLLGPGTVYPSHSHDAEELYVPLSGAALWRRGAEDWRTRRPGEVIHHPGGVPHAMHAGPSPLLALYLWRGGDLTQTSRIG